MTNTSASEVVELLAQWKNISVEDLASLRLNSKIDHSINEFMAILEEIKSSQGDASYTYLSFAWSQDIRDFAILLRDSLLALVQAEQYEKDDRSIKNNYIQEIRSVIQKAAEELSTDYSNASSESHNTKIWEHQKSPIDAVQNQLQELQKQVKKIFRSSAKVDDVRFNIGDYIKDFQLQFARQGSAVKQLFTIIDEVKQTVAGITTESAVSEVSTAVDNIGDNTLKLDLVKGTESMDILPYANNEILTIPVSTSFGNLNYKSINIKSEFARWFSSFIYPKIVELESKRDHAVEKCIFAFSQIRAKIAAINLAESGDSTDIQKEFDTIFSQLDKEVLRGLKEEEEEINKLVSFHLDNHLVASNLYSDTLLFLPESGASQISNISKDAQKRVVSNFKKYKEELKNQLNRILSRYFEVDKTPYSQYVKNLVSIHDEDDSLALFLKKGYLGKSFTEPRPEVIDPIVEDYKLWMDGFAGAVLLSGTTGSGKSTVLGMINHLGLSHEIIQLYYRESYFIKHRSYDPISDFELLIDQVIEQTRGRKVVICIDNLELWHDKEIGLFDNIIKLFEAIVKYRNSVFFVVTCSPFLKDRIQLFKDLNTIFSRQSKLERMNSNQIRNALYLRARVNDKLKIEDVDLDSRFGHILRHSKGNIGLAMLEYCRFHNKEYKPFMKSREFTELIHSHHTLLMFILAYQHASLRVLLTLSDLDYRTTIESIDHLVGQKILIRPKKGSVAINPFLIHHVEQVLIKLTV